MARKDDSDDLDDDLDDDLPEEDDDAGAAPGWRRRLLRWTAVVVAVGLGFLIPYTLYLNHQVTVRFGELRWQLRPASTPARWYSHRVSRWTRAR